MKRVEGKVAIITGAGSGIGKETAITFGLEGAKVVCADIKGAEETAYAITAAGGEAIGITIDITKADQWKSLMEQTKNTFGTVHILCNIAGISEAVNIVDLEEEAFDKMIAVNVKGIYLAMKEVLPEMVQNGGGKIASIASLAAHCGLEGLPSYSASKGAVVAMSRQVAAEYAAKNIQVNVVSPGIIATPILENNSPEMTKAFTEATPAGRLGKPSEIASMLLFLCSNESDFVTGQAILVDGGWSAK